MSNAITKEKSNALKGLCAVGVLCCHLSQNYRGGGVFPSLVRYGFQELGFICVAVFFFVSGYGLETQYEQRDNYLRTFASKRILPHYLKCCLFAVIYLLFGLAFNRNALSLTTVIKTFLFGDTIIYAGWYLQTQLLMYFAFFLSHRAGVRENGFKGKDVNRGTATLLALVILYIAYCLIAGMSSYWYATVLAFPLGVWWKHYGADEIIGRRWHIVLAASGIIAIIAFVITGKTSSRTNDISTCVMSLGAAIFIIVIAERIDIENKVTKWLGEYSLEIYLLQGIPFILWGRYASDSVSGGYYLIFCILGTALLSLIFKPVVKRFEMLNKKR